MGFLRRHDGLGGTRHQMREKLLAIGDDYGIGTGDRPRAFKVEVSAGENDALTFAATVCIDELPAGAGTLSRMDSR